MDRRLCYGTAGAIVSGVALCLAALAHGGETPGVVELASLVQYYAGVEFDHSLHEGAAESCSTCHHHTTGGAAEGDPCATCHDGTQAASSVACRDCHLRDPFTPEHIVQAESGDQWFHVDKPGLKGAYHQNCLSCHQETGAPSGCQDCHARNPAGDALFSATAATQAGREVRAANR